jgi:hypothetical protein
MEIESSTKFLDISFNAGGTVECLDARVNMPEIEGTAQASKEASKHEDSLLSKLAQLVSF